MSHRPAIAGAVALVPTSHVFDLPDRGALTLGGDGGVAALLPFTVMTGELEPIELADAEQDASTDRASRGVHQSPMHAWLRTAAAVVAALSAVWVASAVADMRDVDEKKLCWDQVQSSIPAYAPGPLRPQWVEQLVETAEECDLPVLADAIRQRYADE